MSNALPVPFVPQLRSSLCLPACACMALAYLGVTTDQNALAAQLGTIEAGTPFFRLSRLNVPGIKITLSHSCELSEVIAAVCAGSPCIVSVNTLFLPYSQFEDAHAVVIVDATPEAVTVLDPATDSMPKVVLTGAFLAAWIERDCALAVVAKATPS